MGGVHDPVMSVWGDGLFRSGFLRLRPGAVPVLRARSHGAGANCSKGVHESQGSLSIAPFPRDPMASFAASNTRGEIRARRSSMALAAGPIRLSMAERSIECRTCPGRSPEPPGEHHGFILEVFSLHLEDSMGRTVKRMDHNSQGGVSKGPGDGFQEFSSMSRGRCDDPNGGKGCFTIAQGGLKIV